MRLSWMGFGVARVAVMLSAASPASAAGNEQVTVVPMGRVVVNRLNEQGQPQPGGHSMDLRLPPGSTGPVVQPIVLIAAQPWATVAPGPVAAPLAPEPESDEQQEQREQVSATLKISVGGEKLPDWRLDTRMSAYVIDLETIKRNPKYATGIIALTFELQSGADQLEVLLIAMPDPKLLVDAAGKPVSGPLVDLAAGASDADVKTYFTALATEIAGDKEQARSAYDSLRASKNEEVGRLARRGLRLMSYQLRKRKLSGNIVEHTRWGLYLQFCGLFDAAFKSFDECRIIDPGLSDSQYLAGECLDRTSGNLSKYVHYMDRAGEARKVASPTYWYALVAILKKRGERELTDDEINRIKDQWLYAEEMIWAATGGAIEVSTGFFLVEDEKTFGYKNHGGGLIGPSDDIIETRGWYDSVISVVPRPEDHQPTEVPWCGADAGPNGTAMATVSHDADWPQYLQALYSHVAWAAQVSEVEPGLPSLADVTDCGPQPGRGIGYALRATLHYHLTLAACARLNIAEVPLEGSFLQLWQIEGPLRVNNDRSPAGGKGAGEPAKHVMDAVGGAAAERTLHTVAAGQFVDLAALLPNAGWATARCRTWVYVPEDRQVRLAFGQNDGLAAWVNGRCVRTGRVYSGGKFADRNLPDTVFCAADFKRGWNELVLVVESWPSPCDKGWGFSVSVTTLDGKLIPGLASVHTKPAKDIVPPYVAPKVGAHFAWADVKDDYRRLLPQLAAADLQAITGASSLHVRAEATPLGGFMAMVGPDAGKSPRYREPPEVWNVEADRDVVVNNVMDWTSEACMVYRYTTGGRSHDLLMLKPEAVEAFMVCLEEPDEANTGYTPALYRPVAQRVLGYVVVPVGSSTRTLVVADALLGDVAGWPLDEEDLLTPLGEFVPNPTTELPTEGPMPPPRSPTTENGGSAKPGTASGSPTAN